MRATEIIRDLLDIIDSVEDIESDASDDVNRTKQIADLTSDKDNTAYANTPVEKVASITAVTTNAGGGMNGPKDPADIRGSTQAMYPGKVYGAK